MSIISRNVWRHCSFKFISLPDLSQAVLQHLLLAPHVLSPRAGVAPRPRLPCARVRTGLRAALPPDGAPGHGARGARRQGLRLSGLPGEEIRHAGEVRKLVTEVRYALYLEAVRDHVGVKDQERLNHTMAPIFKNYIFLNANFSPY